ncbi:restriction endonuclease subunit S [Gordonia caeni]|uniref:Type I restriction modification DNA specificity domain-containing protein n=1 Tax=Gordonia caeni TaxID=1007097 RepID=A0ABP7PIW2_9ACTN
MSSTVRLREVGSTYGGLTGKTKADFGRGDARFVTFLEVINSTRLSGRALEQVQVKKGERQNSVKRGDVLFNGSSETPEEVALSAVVDFDPNISTFLNSFCFGFRLRPDAAVDSTYLAYFFRSTAGRSLVSSLAQGATRYNIAKTKFLDVELALPSIERQREIVEWLKDADDLIATLERLIAKKQAIKQGMMQQLLTGRTRLPGFTAPWRETTWGDVAGTISSGSTPRRSRRDFWNGSIPWVTSTELKRGVIRRIPQTITEAGLLAANLTIWPRGTFLMAITGLEAAGTRGSCGILGTAAATNQSCMAILPSEYLDTSFLFFHYLLRGEELAFRYTQGTKQQSYTAGVVRTLPIWLPTDINEQRAIATALLDANAEIEALQTRHEKARAIKTGMMQQLLTGRTRLPVEAVS